MSTNLWSRLSRIGVAVAGLLLTGCFQSEQPKFPLAGAAAPFGDGGRYVLYDRVAEDRYQRQGVIAVKRRPDGAYDLVNEKGEVLTISLHPVGGDRFAGQAAEQKEKDKTTYSYVVFRVTSDEAVLYLPQCDKQDKGLLTAHGVELIGKFECFIDRVADPAGLFKQVELGEPISKLVRE